MELEAKDFKKIPDSPCKKVTKKLIKSKIKLKAIRNMGYVLEVEDEKTND